MKSTRSEAAALLGKKGGESGTGKSKRRGDAAHYRALAHKAAQARKLKGK